MVYVDENLCTGCGLCLEACAVGAITLQGHLAAIDSSACTDCGRCAPVCMTGAIGTAEIVVSAASLVTAASPEMRPAARAPAAYAPVSSPDGHGNTLASRPASASRSVATTTPRGSKLRTIETLVSGLFSAIVLAIDQKDMVRALNRGSGAASKGTGASGCTTSGRRRGRGGPGRGSGRRGGRGQGVGCPNQLRR
jgi:NAD-dependent dihydropyrimidine dehydrogenase PreA subunit